MYRTGHSLALQLTPTDFAFLTCNSYVVYTTISFQAFHAWNTLNLIGMSSRQSEVNSRDNSDIAWHSSRNWGGMHQEPDTAIKSCYCIVVPHNTIRIVKKILRTIWLKVCECDYSREGLMYLKTEIYLFKYPQESIYWLIASNCRVQSPSSASCPRSREL